MKFILDRVNNVKSVPLSLEWENKAIDLWNMI